MKNILLTISLSSFLIGANSHAGFMENEQTPSVHDGKHPTWLATHSEKTLPTEGSTHLAEEMIQATRDIYPRPQSNELNCNHDYPSNNTPGF